MFGAENKKNVSMFFKNESQRKTMHYLNNVRLYYYLFIYLFIINCTCMIFLTNVFHLEKYNENV